MKPPQDKQACCNSADKVFVWTCLFSPCISPECFPRYGSPAPEDLVNLHPCSLLDELELVNILPLFTVSWLLVVSSLAGMMTDWTACWHTLICCRLAILIKMSLNYSLRVEKNMNQNPACSVMSCQQIAGDLSVCYQSERWHLRRGVALKQTASSHPPPPKKRL